MKILSKKLCLGLILLVNALCANHEISVPLLHVTEANKRAMAYVGQSNVQNGRMQLEVLLREGLQKTDYVLEVGCGALMAGIPTMSFLDTGHFIGVEPNKWLVDASLEIEANRRIVEEKQPCFLHNENFDGSDAHIQCDYILAHSIISHAPLWQFRLFLENCAKVLKKGGRVVFSLRLTEQNPWDGLGIKEESTTTAWQYPGNTFFHRATVIKEAAKWFRKVEQKESYTQLIMSSDSSAFHEWFVLTK